MNENRLFTIIRTNAEFDQNADKLQSAFEKLGRVVSVKMQEGDTEPKLRNRINRECKLGGNTRFHHVVLDSVELLGDVSKFLDDLEKAMDVLDYRVWFNTACDPCNYVYNKYNPRVTVQTDAPECKSLGLETPICFTSHSNQMWICYDMANATDSQLRLDEDFTVPMYWIIEFLARRRNEGAATDIYFMNQYMTVASERGLFRALKPKNPKPDDQATLKSEDAAFQAKKINYSVDNSVDMVLDRLWNKMLSKVPKTA